MTRRTPTPHRIVCLAVALLATTLPTALAHHDGDPVTDGAELVLCGSPAAGLLADPLAPHEAGDCAGPDYVNPAFPCQGCGSATLLSLDDLVLFPGKTIQPVPLPPEDVPPVGPVPTPPVNVPVGTLEGKKDPTVPGRYCVTVTLADGFSRAQCANLGPAAGPLAPDFGPIPLVEVESEDVGPTPGVEEGELGDSPSERVPRTTVDLVITYSWVESRLSQRVGPGSVNVWEPVDLLDPAAIAWWLGNGDETGVTITAVVETDGQPAFAQTHTVPFAGQALAAALRSG